VLFQNEINVHLVGFTIEIYYDAQSYKRQNCIKLPLLITLKHSKSAAMTFFFNCIPFYAGMSIRALLIANNTGYL
jgi:hypothetical protein